MLVGVEPVLQLLAKAGEAEKVVLALLFHGRPAAYGALGLQYLVRHPAAFFAEIGVLVLCAAVRTLANHVPVWQKLVIISAVKLDDALVIDMAVFEQLLENLLYKLDVFDRACLVKEVKGDPKRGKVLIVPPVPVLNIFRRGFLFLLCLYQDWRAKVVRSADVLDFPVVEPLIHTKNVCRQIS